MDILEKIRKFIIKLQSFPENKKKIILWTIVVILAIIMGIFWIRGAINSLSKMRGDLGEIEMPEMDFSDMPKIDLQGIGDIIQTTTPSDERVLVENANQTNDWMKCVGNCDFYTDKVLGEIINKNCIDACSGKYKFAPEYKYLDSAILFLSPEVKSCKNILDNSLREECLYSIPQKYLINK